MERIVTRTQTPLPQRARRSRTRTVLVQQSPVQKTVVVEVPMATNAKSKTRRNKRRRNRKNANPTTITDMGGSSLVTYSPGNVMPYMQNSGSSTSGRAGLRANTMKRVSGAKVTPEGVRFLKCAFSAADFDGSGTYGVPDSYSGKSSAIKHRSTYSQALTNSFDYYVLLAPVPGYSHFTTTTVAGTLPTASSVWTGVAYSDYSSLFGNPDVASYASKYRFVSNHLEIICTSNANSWSGSIQTFKLPLEFSKQITTTTAIRMSLNGLNGVATTNADQYSGPFNLGCYVGAYNKGGDSWDFSDVISGQGSIPETITSLDWGQLTYDGTNALPGFDNNHESAVMKISGMSANQSCLFKTWACVEYQFTPGTVMYEMQNLRCIEDKFALELYRQIVMELPIAVSSFDNPDFWKRVLGIIQTVAGTLAILPGPYGAIAGGVSAISGGLRNLVF